LGELQTKAKVARGTTYMFIQGFVNAVLGLIYFITLAHALSDQEMGVFALMAFALYLPQVFGIFALQSAAIKFISQYIAEGNSEKARSVVSRVVQVCSLSSAVAFVALFIPAEGLSMQLFNTAQHALLLRILALTSVFNILYILASGFLQGMQRIRDLAAIGLVYTILQNAVGIFLLYLGWRLYAVVYCWLAGLSVASILGLMIVTKNLGVLGKPHELKPLFRFSFPLYAAGILGYFVGWIDQLILYSYTSALHGGAAEAQRVLGVYNVAIRASTVPTLFSAAALAALFPQLSELYTLQGLNRLGDAFRASTRYLVFVGFPLIIGLATLARPAIILFAGWQYVEAAEPLMIICIAAMAGTLGIAVGPILLTLERTTVASVLSVVSVVLSAALSFFMLSYAGLGMIGTAWARALVAVIGLALNLYVLTKFVPVSFDKEALKKASAASAIMVLAIVALDSMRIIAFHSSTDFLENFLVIRLHLLPIYVAVGGAAYALALVKLRAVKSHDVELVEEYLPKKLQRVATWLKRFAVAE